MIPRYTAFLGVALATIASVGHAQPGRAPSREDLLDQLTRDIQICAEVSDNQQRLACYDKVQNHVGDAQASSRQPVPLAANPPSSAPPSGGAPFGATPLAPPGGSAGTLGPQGQAPPLTSPPLMTPGGGVATLGGPQGQPNTLAPPGSDPDAAYDPSRSGSSYPSDMTMPKPQPPIRRTGPRPLPYSPQPMPLVTLTANNLTYGASRYWQVSVSVTSNTPNTIDTQIQCTFRNAGRSVGEAYLGPVGLAPGEQISTELIGPPTTTYVDSTNCRVLSP